MPSVPDRETCCVAVDWSGAVHGERRKIWLAVARGGRVERLEGGRSRAEVVDHVIELAAREPRLVVGLDFAFSLPEWFVRARGCSTGREVWELVAREGEGWLKACDPPFWGRAGTRKHRGHPLHRATESVVPTTRGVGPKSVFQINGAGQVGTGSLRGIPWLSRLSGAGFAVWPFDAAGLPLVVEIYPRELTGKVVKTSEGGRTLWLEDRARDQRRELVDRARTSDDAFDAFASALVMSRHARAFARLEPARDAHERLEGCIWRPEVDPWAPAS